MQVSGYDNNNIWGVLKMSEECAIVVNMIIAIYVYVEEDPLKKLICRRKNRHITFDQFTPLDDMKEAIIAILNEEAYNDQTFDDQEIANLYDQNQIGDELQIVEFKENSEFTSVEEERW